MAAVCTSNLKIFLMRLQRNRLTFVSYAGGLSILSMTDASISDVLWVVHGARFGRRRRSEIEIPILSVPGQVMRVRRQIILGGKEEFRSFDNLFVRVDG